MLKRVVLAIALPRQSRILPVHCKGNNLYIKDIKTHTSFHSFSWPPKAKSTFFNLLALS